MTSIQQFSKILSPHCIVIELIIHKFIKSTVGTVNELLIFYILFEIYIYIFMTSFYYFNGRNDV